MDPVGIVIIGKTEGVVGIQPTMILVSARTGAKEFCFHNFFLELY
jgi:hypothetical protein